MKEIKSGAAVLDACCGSRMFWFDPKNPNAVFVDNRSETHSLKDSSQKKGFRILNINPDVVASFEALPFKDAQFSLVVFDPPHLTSAGRNGWLAKKYGRLHGDWKPQLAAGFKECFRVLKPQGTLIFKWNERDVPVSQILELTDHRPLFGNRCGKASQSHWIVFLK
jgi:ubiquinone/menaquinone biosynthesis C-methylase UbiE